MNRLFILAFLIFLFTFKTTLHAQKNWKEITLVTKDNETIIGEVSIKTNFKYYPTLPVRDKITHAFKTYYPRDVKSFTIKMEEQDLYFKVFRIEAEYSENDLPLLDNSPTITLVTDTVFAQLLVGGSKNLYYFKDKRVFKDHFLLQSTADEAIELVNKKYYVDAAKTMVNYNQEYKNQLNRLLLNSPVINAQRINSTLFVKSKIKALIKDYNESVDDKQPAYEQMEEKMSVSFGIIAGCNNTSLKFKGSYPELNQLQFNNSKGINAGIKLDLTIPKTRKKWSIYNELLFSNYNFVSKDYYSIYLNEKSYDIANYRFKASYLKLVNAFRFKLTYPIAPFIQFGIANGFALHHSGTKLTQHTFNGVTTSYVTPFYSYRIYEQSILAGVGIDYKKMGVEFRYEKGNGMSGVHEISSKLDYMYILLNYSF